MSAFQNLLAREKCVLFDGGMGTMLYERGVFLNQCFDSVHLDRPALVEEIHREYVTAGAQVIETNTFGANPFKLAGHGLAERLEEINTRAVEVARRAAAGQALVAGSIGPLGVRIEPWGPTARDEARQAFAAQARALIDAGVDLLVLETFFDLAEIEQALAAVRGLSSTIPLVASMTLGEDGTSLFGTPPEIFTRRLAEWGADVVGLNCAEGPAVMIEAIPAMREATSLPLIVRPNAGRPRNVSGRNLYMSSPEYFAEYARRFLALGVTLLGGCCGTTPAHIRAIAGAVRSFFPGSVRPETDPASYPLRIDPLPPAAEPVPFAERSKLAALLATGTFACTIEIVPPRGTDPDRAIAVARRAAKAGIDALNVPDGPRASSRMSALATALLMQRESGGEAILHYTCRDRNILGIQSDLLGADALGIRNLLLITGDPPKMGTYPDATGVFDIDSIGLVNVVATLNRGADLGRNPIGRPTRFVIGVGLNPLAVNPDYELQRFAYKVEAGAEFAITQPVFDVDRFLAFLDRVAQAGIDIPILAGVWPLTSLANALFMRNEIPGSFVPDQIIERMRATTSREQGLAVGVEIAGEIVSRVRDRVAGLQLSIPGGTLEYALKLAALARSATGKSV